MLVMVLAMGALGIRGVELVQRRIRAGVMLVSAVAVLVMLVAMRMRVAVGVDVRSRTHADSGKNAEDQQPFEETRHAKGITPPPLENKRKNHRLPPSSGR